MARMHAPETALLRWLFPLAAVIWLAPGCSMDPKECAKLRADAFELINAPSSCNADQDCRATEWPPGCPKPINQANFEKIRKFREAAQKGKCVETPISCGHPPAPLYCQEGLCAFKYKNPPRDDDIRIE
jgi:hypothetical protein